MIKKKLGLENAYPTNYKEIDSNGRWVSSSGMSKRFYAACAAMQGLLANNDNHNIKNEKDVIVYEAYLLADELLKQENE